MSITKLNPNQVPLAGAASGIYPAGTNLQFWRGDNSWQSISTITAGLQQFMDNILYVSAGFTADGVHSFTTIASAVAAWTTGKVIFLAPETFSENVTLSSAGMNIIGVSKTNSIIGNLSITGKDCYIRELNVSGDLEILCSDSFTPTKWIELSNCIFSGNVSIGTSVSQSLYKTRFFNCNINGASKNLIINIFASDLSLVFYNTDILSTSGNNYTLSIYQGQVYFNNCPYCYFNNLNYYNLSTYGSLQFYHCKIWIRIDFVTQTTNTLQSVLYVEESVLLKSGAYSGNWTFNGLFEFNVMRSSMFYANIVFNSTANSRFVNVEALATSSNTITGTGLSHLYIKKSSFGIAVPNGLGGDKDNLWEDFIDG